MTMVVCLQKTELLLIEPTKIYGREKVTSILSLRCPSVWQLVLRPFTAEEEWKVEKTKTRLWSQIDTCCVNKEQEPTFCPTHPPTQRHAHTEQRLGLESSKEMPRNEGQVEPTRSLVAGSWGYGGGRKVKHKKKRTRRVREKQTMKSVLILFHRHWHIFCKIPQRQALTGFSVPRSTPGRYTAIPLGGEEE